VRVRAAAEYATERGRDCSIDDGYQVSLPASDLVEGMRLRWTGNDGAFVDDSGAVVAFDPSTATVGPSALLVRYEALTAFLAKEKLALCWTVIGEKRVLSMRDKDYCPIEARMSGALQLNATGPHGFTKFIVHRYASEGAPERVRTRSEGSPARRSGASTWRRGVPTR
jgi:hypothetical protein